MVKFFGGAALGIGGLFLLIIMGTLMGGVAGWTVGLVFDETLAALKGVLGVSISNFQLGAMLGFAGGFFRVRVTSKESS